MQGDVSGQGSAGSLAGLGGIVAPAAAAAAAALAAPPVARFASGAALADVVDRVAPLLPDLLMPRPSLDHARRVARLFPAWAVNFFGFECRLAAGSRAGTDCALSLSPAGAQALAEGRIGPGDGAWPRIARFCRWWGETHRDPFSDATAVWLEFDASAPEPAPNLMFGYWTTSPGADRPWPAMRDAVLPALFDGRFSAPLRDNLDRCVAACPPGTGDFQIGAMLGRPVQAVRLCIFDMPLDELPAYLDAVGWAGDRAALDRLAAALRPHCDLVGLHFDVAAHTLPRIGIEPAFRSGTWSRQPHREPRWAGIWAALTREGLLDEAKRDALLLWRGHQQVAVDGRPGLLLRGLSHVKVALGDDGAALAKAYFGIALRAARAGAGA